MKNIPLFLITLFSSLLLAAANPTTLILHPENSDQQQVYLLHNISQQAIFLNHPVENPSASAGWGSPLNPGAWSAFAINRPNFVLTCADAKDFKLIDCSKVIYLKKAKNMKTRGNGTYWLEENSMSENFIK